MLCPIVPSDQSVRWHNCLGTYTYANGDKYVGGYKDDKMHGQGTYTYARGDKYVGEFKDGEFHGQGTYTFANGDKYVGGIQRRQDEMDKALTLTPMETNTSGS